MKNSNDAAKTSQPQRAWSKATRELDAALKAYPAPWQHELSDRLSDGSDCLEIEGANGSSIAEMQCSLESEKPLARLIVAAPDLFAALRRMLADVEAYQSNPNGHSPTNCIADARAALAKAEGGER
jgi:hypothetical protein